MANQPYRPTRPGCPGQPRPGYGSGRPMPYPTRPDTLRHPCDSDCRDEVRPMDNAECCPECSPCSKVVCPEMESVWDLRQFPVGMTYVPMQSWGPLYDHQKALQRGTMFPELDKPFIGRRACR